MDERIWEELLSTALDILDDLEARGLGAPEFAMGGGTALMMRMHHRVSMDIDLFLHDAQWLARLTPRLNDFVAEIALDYAEQANSLKLVLARGDIDFVVAGSVTAIAPKEALEFRGRKIWLEATEEILAKKLYFRAALLKPRDVFDLVAAHELFPDAAARAIDAAASRRDLQLARLRELALAPEPVLTSDIVPSPEFARLIPSLIATAIDVIKREAGAPK